MALAFTLQAEISTTKMFTEENSRCYNLTGQPISKEAKGVVVRKGKKVLVK